MFPEGVSMNLLTIVIMISLVLTIIVMAAGIGSMAQGGEYDKKHGAQLMTARVGMQSITLLLLFFAIYLANT